MNAQQKLHRMFSFTAVAIMLIVTVINSVVPIQAAPVQQTTTSSSQTIFLPLVTNATNDESVQAAATNATAVGSIGSEPMWAGIAGAQDADYIENAVSAGFYLTNDTAQPQTEHLELELASGASYKSKDVTVPSHGEYFVHVKNWSPEGGYATGQNLLAHRSCSAVKCSSYDFRLLIDNRGTTAQSVRSISTRTKKVECKANPTPSSDPYMDAIDNNGVVLAQNVLIPAGKSFADVTGHWLETKPVTGTVGITSTMTITFHWQLPSGLRQSVDKITLDDCTAPQPPAPSCVNTVTSPIVGTSIKAGTVVHVQLTLKDSSKARIVRIDTGAVVVDNISVTNNVAETDFTPEPGVTYQGQGYNDANGWSNQGCQMSWNDIPTPVCKNVVPSIPNHAMVATGDNVQLIVNGQWNTGRSARMNPIFLPLVMSENTNTAQTITGMEYQLMKNGAAMADWSTNNSFVFTVEPTVTYKVFVRATGSDQPVTSDSCAVSYKPMPKTSAAVVMFSDPFGHRLSADQIHIDLKSGQVRADYDRKDYDAYSLNPSHQPLNMKYSDQYAQWAYSVSFRNAGEKISLDFRQYKDPQHHIVHSKAGIETQAKNYVRIANMASPKGGLHAGTLSYATQDTGTVLNNLWSKDKLGEMTYMSDGTVLIKATYCDQKICGRPAMIVLQKTFGAVLVQDEPGSHAFWNQGLVVLFSYEGVDISNSDGFVAPMLKGGNEFASPANFVEASLFPNEHAQAAGTNTDIIDVGDQDWTDQLPAEQK